MTHPSTAVAAVLAAVTLTACGSAGGTSVADPPSRTDPPSEPAAMEPAADQVADAVGRTYVSTDVTVDGEPWPLAVGSRLRFVLEERYVGADAGCNGMGGKYELDGQRLLVDELARTAMGCDPPLMKQEEWLANLLTGGPVLTVDGDYLTLTSGDTTVSLVDREAVAQDRPRRTRSGLRHDCVVEETNGDIEAC